MKPVEIAERKIPANVALLPRQILRLRQRAEVTGNSVSELVRQAIDLFLERAP